MIAGPFIFMFGLILLLILLLVGSRKKIQGLVFISKIGLVMFLGFQKHLKITYTTRAT